jgi:alpha-tubulin suppressor-like RCC1 family protein
MVSVVCFPPRHARAIGAAVLVAVAGCQDSSQVPTGPQDPATPAAALEAATAATVSFTQLSAGGSHTCALAADGRVYCWGLNENGQLGDGTRTNHSSPKVVAGTLRFVQVSAGAYHTCALAADNRAYCWGAPQGGATGFFDDLLTPTAVPGGRRFVRLRSGTYHTCGVNPYDVGFCWGKKAFGELGAGTNYYTGETPIRIAGGLSFRSVIAGGGFTCGVTTSNKGYCWGYNLDGAVGDGTRTNRNKPTAVAGGLSFRSVIAGGGLISDEQGTEVDETHACGLTTDNLAYCWGQGSNGQLGDGTPDGTFTSSRVRPFRVVGGLHFGQVIAGYYHSCGVTTTKVAYCWGAGSKGQLGNGSTSFGRSSPTKVAGGLLFAGVSAGPVGNHTCGITTGNKIYCWGDNAFGQLGDGTTTRRLSPVKVAGQS